MKIRWLFLLALLTYILETSVFQMVRISGVMPNVSLVLVVTFCVVFGRREGMILGAFSGLLTDLFVTKVLGINFMLYLLIAWVIGSLEDSIFKDNFLTPIVLTAVSTIVYQAIYLGIFFLFRSPFDDTRLFMIVGIEIVLNAIVGVFLYGWLFKRQYGYGLR